MIQVWIHAVASTSVYAHATLNTNGFVVSISSGANATSFDITHNLGSRDITIQVYDATTYEEVIVDITRKSTTVATIAFANAPANGKKYRVVCIG